MTSKFRTVIERPPLHDRHTKQRVQGLHATCSTQNFNEALERFGYEIVKAYLDSVLRNSKNPQLTTSHTKEANIIRLLMNNTSDWGSKQRQRESFGLENPDADL